MDELGEDKYVALKNSEYQFVIDPIDGTQMYALKMPCYAISIGIMKNCKPYLGAVCLLALGEMVYFDGENVHWGSKINSADEFDTVIEPQEL